MQITLPPKLSLMATNTVRLTDFGIMDGIYLINEAKHSISRKSYTMQVSLSRVPGNGQVQEDTSGADAGAGTGGGTYMIKKGDTLWDLAQEWYGNPARCTEIYQANAAAIEADAKRHGKASSNNGYWIFPGLEIVKP